MIANSPAVALPEQPNLSNRVRVILKRTASQNGGLAAFMRELGIPYQRVWEQMNRCQGVRVDLLPALTAGGIDEPLRVVADACGYDVTPKVKFLRKKKVEARPVRSHALDIHHAAAAVTAKIEEALTDRQIDDREREAIKSALHGLRKKMAELEDRIGGQSLRKDLGIDSNRSRLQSAALATRAGTTGRVD